MFWNQFAFTISKIYHDFEGDFRQKPEAELRVRSIKP
jgi:hypothetical protein